MNARFFLALSLILGAVLLLGNKYGRASFSNIGNTGAPGDDAYANGTPRTCSYCHAGNLITASLDITVFDSSLAPVTQYVPGQLYTARVKINATGTNLKGYGFQMIALRDMGNTDLDGFSDINPNNYKIATITNGRTYAEHDNVSDSSYFDVRWTAPPAGTGPITFYAAGNGVNKDNNSGSKDGSAANMLHLQEDTSGVSASGTLLFGKIALSISPNPLTGDIPLLLTFSALKAVPYQIMVRDFSGNLVWNDTRRFSAGKVSLALPSGSWPSGIYNISLSASGVRQNVKVLKI